MDIEQIMQSVGIAIDAAGVLVIVVGVIIAAWQFALRRQGGPDRSYGHFRRDLGRAILLGLEFLVAGDIIRTIVVAPTLQNLYVLGLIVLIRTFLSMTIEVEIKGRWPWQGEGKSREQSADQG